MVFFTDKDNTPYTISSPEEFLSEAAISRRESQEIPITAEDLPVDPDYLDQVANLGVDVFFSTKWLNGVLIQTDESKVSELEDLSFVSHIEFVAPGEKLNNRVREHHKIRDVKEESDGGVADLAQNVMLGIPQMHGQGFKGEDMTIAVFDGGFKGVPQLDVFEDLVNDSRVVDAMNYVHNSSDVFDFSSNTSDHGTRVLSCMAADLPGTMVGTAPEANYILYVTEDSEPEHRIEEYNWLFAAERADSIGADIINSSVGYADFDDPSMNYTFEDFDGEQVIVTIAAQKAVSKGIIVVCSAGNEANKPWMHITAPADGEDVIAVGAISADSTLAVFSSPGPTFDQRIKPDLVAVGLSTTVARSSGVSTSSGTSFASPLVAGLIAGYWQANRHLSALEVIEHVRGSGHLAFAPNNSLGFGIPSFTRLQEVTSINEASMTQIKIYPNPNEQDVFYIEVGDFFKFDDYQVLLYDLTGNLLVHEQIERDPLEHRHQVSTEGIAPGNYIMHLTSGNLDYGIRIVKN